MNNNFLLGISHSSWEKTCDMFFNPNISNSLSMYLQDYPLTKIGSDLVDSIKSEYFFNEYIATGKIFFNPTVLKLAPNFLTKNSGGFRDAILLSPFLFLILQAVGVEIQVRYHPLRSKNSKLLAYYAGDFSQNIVTYKSRYKAFCQVNTQLSKEYPFFIKTDISDYYSNINLDKLITNITDRIDEEKEKKFTPLQLRMIKELLYYCGRGKFPLVENSTCSSFLATIVYLDQIDLKMGSFISEIEGIEDYQLVRYVDDLFIWLRPKSFSDENKSAFNEEYNAIRFKYSSLLRSYGLTLNTSKTSFHESENISEQLKVNVYDDFAVEPEDTTYLSEQDATQKIEKFIDDLKGANENHDLTKEELQELINTDFRPQNTIEYTGEEVLKNIIFKNSGCLENENIILSLQKILDEQGISFIYLSPKLLTNMILNTESGQDKNTAVKTLLNDIFQQSKSGLLNAYDVNISLYYLLRTRFCHTDLKHKIIEQYDESLFYYIKHFCEHNFCHSFSEEYQNQTGYLQVIGSDWKTYYLYVNYLFEKERNNLLEMFAFYKTYFDRITALIAALVNKSAPVFKDFYDVNSLNSVYEDLHNANSYKVIKKANALRNKNPLVHSSAEMIGNKSARQDVLKCIMSLQNLLDLRITSLSILD